jgi:hypothetical protein
MSPGHAASSGRRGRAGRRAPSMRHRSQRMRKRKLACQCRHSETRRARIRARALGLHELRTGRHADRDKLQPHGPLRPPSALPEHAFETRCEGVRLRRPAAQIHGSGAWPGEGRKLRQLSEPSGRKGVAGSKVLGLKMTLMYGPAVRGKRFRQLRQMRSCINVSGL